MKIMRDQQSKFWVLTSNSRVLYKGRRSPWDDPSIIRQALARERQLSRTQRDDTASELRRRRPSGAKHRVTPASGAWHLVPHSFDKDI